MRIDKTGRDGEAGNVNAERIGGYGARFADAFDSAAGGHLMSAICASPREPTSAEPPVRT